MASVFLSYDRDDGAAAKVIATALERAAHSVWWDLHVRGGAQFSKVIEEALKAADVVVVLWSAQSIESAWVRDEAATGRDSGRLIPATIDGAEPPLGFRQFQTIDLRDWKRGPRSRGYKELQRTIGETANATAPQPALAQPISERQPLKLALWVLVVAVVCAIVVAGYLLWPEPTSTVVPTVTVVPASNERFAQELSRDLFAKLGALQSADSAALQLVEPSADRPPDLIFKVDGLNEGDQSKATVMLLAGRNHALLWSSDYEQPASKPADLRQQLAYSAADVLDCAAESLGPGSKSLDEQSRRLYLTGCGALSRASGADLISLVRTFREVTQRAPRLEGAWEKLLTAEDELFFTPLFVNDWPSAQSQFRADIAAARRVNPDIAEGYTGEADLAGWSAIGERLRLVELAVEKNPDSPVALTERSSALMGVGRMRDAIDDAKRAVQIRPFSSRTQDAYISALMYAGQFDAANEALRKAEALWPGATNLEFARFRLNLRYGPPQEAVEQLKADPNFAFSGAEIFLNARLNPSPANVTAILAAERKLLNSGIGSDVGNYVQTLAQFGRKDELLTFLLRWPTTSDIGFAGVMFRPQFRDFWRDPQSMRAAAHLGMLSYWQKTGKWPDFCSEPDLPYDCKKEAAKLKT